MSSDQRPYNHPLQSRCALARSPPGLCCRGAFCALAHAMPGLHPLSTCRLNLRTPTIRRLPMCSSTTPATGPTNEQWHTLQPRSAVLGASILFWGFFCTVPFRNAEGRRAEVPASRSPVLVDVRRQRLAVAVGVQDNGLALALDKVQLERTLDTKLNADGLTAS